MDVRKATEDDIDAWVEMRHELWPHHGLVELMGDSREILESPDQVCFLLIHPDSGYAGFIEGQLYSDSDKPYVHVEGWYVRPEFRGFGWGRKLVSSLKQWSLHRGITIMTSDTSPDYPLSPDAHARSGFHVLAEMTIFVKEL